jgi:NADH-quinone oxidoreductase subunit G
LKNTPSVCSGCARGCNIHLGIHENRIWRILPRENEAVNRSWICDEGRLSHAQYQSAQRLGGARAGRKVGAGAAAGRRLLPEAAWEQAAAMLGEIARNHGGAAVAAITSGHATVEEQVALAEIMTLLGGTRIALPVHERGQDDDLLLRRDKTMNSLGARLAGGANATLQEVLSAAAKGEVRALIVLREDPLGEEAQGAERALQALDLLITLDWRISATVDASDLAFPLSAFGEMDGSAINLDGRIQLLRPGLTPFQEADPGWKPLYEIAARLGGREVPRTFRGAFRAGASKVAALSGLDTPALGQSGALLSLSGLKES